MAYQLGDVMSCKKHIQRKRPNSCPDCKAELVAEELKNMPVNHEAVVRAQEHIKNSKVTKVVREEEEVDVRTSRDMLKDLDQMEQECDNLVMKKTRKPKEPKEDKTEMVKEGLIKVQQAIDIVEAKHKIDANKEVIDDYFDLKLKEFKGRVAALATLSYENLYVPNELFNLTLMDKLNKEKWRLINFWDVNIAKASGIKRDVAVLERIVNPDNKPRPEFKL